MYKEIDEREGYRKNVVSQEADFRLTRAPNAGQPNQTDTWWSVLLDIEGSIQEFISRADRFLDENHNEAAREKSFLVPVEYDRKDRLAQRGRQAVVIFARQGFVHVLNQNTGSTHEPNRFGIVDLHLGAVVRRDALNFEADWPDNSPIIVSDDAVVMAVIDDGLGIANDLFRTGPVRSRVQYAAILDANINPHGVSTSVGRALERAEIDALLAECTEDHLLDEDRFYTLTGQVNYYNQVFSTVALRSSHGTHVMGVAAGFPMHKQKTDRPIICAALPSRLVEDTTGVDLLPALYLSFHILVKQAGRFQTKSGALAPAMFNLSYGNAGGPHDGTGLFAGLFDRYFDLDQGIVAEQQKIWLTIPAGNLNLSRMHGVAEPGDSETTLSLAVQPDDRTATLVQIWMPHPASPEQAEQAKIQVTDPFGQDVSLVTDAPSGRSIRNVAGQEIGRLSYEYSPAPIERGFVLLALNPSASLDPDEATVPCGNWTIKIRRKPDAVDQIHAWVRRDETLPGFTSGGRQAYFNNDDYQRFNKFGAPLPVDPPGTQSPIRRAMTLSGYACGQAPVVVAAFTEKQSKLSDYSAAGPLNEPASEFAADRCGPDLSAKGDDSLVRRGVINAGSRSGTMVRQGGTSTAAPQMARAATDAIAIPGLVAREWAKSPTSYSDRILEVPLAVAEDLTRLGSGAFRLKGSGNKYD
ncbi:S8 family serine peptidase [uncultured Tateyamaria sp.]|uniref:S8 family serine peptidase n=1 Tax=uncultured Tateyamaria sp. TaxID=455651 RepID=UPI002613E844|nr:S8 family serine peptidase [uncultured Tateyamaria sp.]